MTDRQSKGNVDGAVALLVSNTEAQTPADGAPAASGASAAGASAAATESKDTV